MAVEGGSKMRGTLSESQQGLFSKGTNFFGFNSKRDTYKNYTGQVAAPFREMMIGREMKSGSHAKHSWSTSFYSGSRAMELPYDYNGVGKHSTKNGLKTKKSWAAFGGGEIIHLKDFREMRLQMTIAAHQLPIAAEHWRFVLAQRALKIFQDSFSIKRFYSKGSKRWAELKKSTIKKRKRKGTWFGTGGILQETNALYNSLEYIPTVKSFTSGVRANRWYAGVHNDAEDGDHVPRRQFMGHSTLIDDFVASYERAYLFDTVFRKQMV